MERKRTIKKQFWVSPEEDNLLKKKVHRTGLNEATVLRMLISDYHPKEQPDDRFYAAMQELNAIGNNLNELVRKANTLGFVDAPMLRDEAVKWAKFQSKIEEEFLLPEKR